MEIFARTARLAALTGIILYFWIPRSAEALTITCGVSPCETLPSAQAHAKAEAGGGSTDNKLGSPPLPASSDFFGGHATASVVADPTPDLMATAMVSGAESQTDDALATLTYKAQVVAISPLAPDAPVKVIIDGKLTITGSLSANTASSYSAQAGAMFSVAPSTPIVPDQLGPYDPSISCEAPFSLSPCGSAKVPVPIHTSGYVSLGGIINVDLTAEAQVGNSSPSGNANAFAEVDPSIFIDPSFPNADMYTIITSPGIGSAAGSSPGTPVPEPGSLAILVTAIFAIARVSLLRRARWITEAVAI